MNKYKNLEEQQSYICYCIWMCDGDVFWKKHEKEKLEELLANNSMKIMEERYKDSGYYRR